MQKRAQSGRIISLMKHAYFVRVSAFILQKAVLREFPKYIRRKPNP